ncbi:MAG TPA: glycosyltransferase family 1 protein [Candidatus Didemnitutus sp.]|nr:glycosyltransferase family 1 protein [Candidatus Didemnitutus sp.]
MIVGFDATSLLGHSGIEVYGRELIRGIIALKDPTIEMVLMGRRRREGELRSFFGKEVQIRAVLPHDLMLGETLRPISRLLQKGAWKNNARDLDLVHMPGNTLWRIPSNRHVVTIHDVFPLMPELGIAASSAREFQRYVESAVKHAERVIVPTQWAAESVSKFLPQATEKLRVVYHSIREQFVRSPLGLQRRRELGIRDDEDFLFFVGRVDPRKNLDRILAAWNTLPSSFREGRLLFLVLSGAPRDIADLRVKHAKTLQDPSIKIHFGLSDQDIVGLYSSARGLVFTSTAEGFGLPVLEAMQCGCPILTSTTTCLPEVGGDAVLYADPYSVDEISNGMYRLLTDDTLGSMLKERGLHRASQFTREAMAKNTLAVYKEIVAH